jgi:hypothetical protein
MGNRCRFLFPSKKGPIPFLPGNGLGCWARVLVQPPFSLATMATLATSDSTSPKSFQTWVLCSGASSRRVAALVASWPPGPPETAPQTP